LGPNQDVPCKAVPRSFIFIHYTVPQLGPLGNEGFDTVSQPISKAPDSASWTYSRLVGDEQTSDKIQGG
jgi:hypothetical protein